jgi:hypothetical protein
MIRHLILFHSASCFVIEAVFDRQMIRSSFDEGKVSSSEWMKARRILYLGTRDEIDFYSSKKVTDLKIRVEEKI